MAKSLHQVGRLAFRREGTQWNAYWTLPDTMDGSILLGSVPITAAEKNEKVKDSFIALMRDVVSTLVPGMEWPNPPRPAPENERAGHA